MTRQDQIDIPEHHRLSVVPAEALRVISGVAIGDTLGDMCSVCLGDGYALQQGMHMSELALTKTRSEGPNSVYKVVSGSLGELTGARVTVLAQLTFVTQIGATVEALLLACDGPAARHYVHPLGPIEPRTEYSLIAVDETVLDIPLIDGADLCFGRGTRITMSDGSQRPVETLKVGDRVLTRDNGMQPIRWMGHRTVQAAGRFAPVVISPGALGNVETLTLSQSHRMLITDWRAEVLTGSRDVLISASDLINEETIYIRSGGFVDYIQLVFDQHQIVYAEGVPTESLLVTQQMLSNMSKDAASEILNAFPDLQAAETQYCRTPLDSKSAQDLLRQTGRL